MVLLQSTQCVEACKSLGETGGIVVSLLAFAFAMWQRYQKSKAVLEAMSANQKAAQAEGKAAQAESEKEVYKQISLRPAGVPLIGFPSDMLARMSVPAPDAAADEDDSIPLSVPPEFESSPTVRARPGPK